jgi:hypothetical protein
MSSNGQYMAIVGKSTGGTSFGNITIAISSNYGATFSVYTTAFYVGTGNNCSVAVSAGGSYISYVAYNTTSGNSWRYYSSNYGSSFSSAGISTSQLFNDIAISSTGQYQLIADLGGNIFRSYDYGATFPATAILVCPNPKFCGMTDDGVIMTICGANGDYIQSNNYGAGWYIYAGPFSSPIGMAVSVDKPSSSNYSAVFQTTYCNYNQPAYTTFYSQPIAYNMSSLSNIYKKAINY